MLRVSCNKLRALAQRLSASSGTAERGGWAKAIADVHAVLRQRPFVVLSALACLVILLVPGVVGVTYAAKQEVVRHKELALEGVCQELASGITQQLDAIFLGVKAMVSHVRQNPNCSVLDRTFMDMSRDIKTWDVNHNIVQLEADPSGVITYLEPPVPEELSWLYGYDMLHYDSGAAETMIPYTSSWIFQGPKWQPDGFYGGYVVYALFLPAKSYEQDMGCGIQPYNCSRCWDEKLGLKFWGFVQGMINLNDTYNGEDPRLVAVRDRYNYHLHVAYDLEPTDINYALVNKSITTTPDKPMDPVKRDIRVSNLHWVIEIAPKGGWEPSWFGPCIAAAVVGALLIAGLLLWLMVVWELQLVQVTKCVRAEMRLKRIQDAERRLLEEVYPKHVLEVLAARRTHEMDELDSRGNNHQLGDLAVHLPHLNQHHRTATNSGSVFNSQSAESKQALRLLARTHEQVTILFADIVTFTNMCDKVPAGAVMAFLNHLFHCFDAALERHGVHKVETIGDCYMVVGGLFQVDDSGCKAVIEHGVDTEHAQKVFGFAKDMLRIASRLAVPTGEPLQIRVGIHSGPVMSGVVGHKMPRFDLFGDTVNTASRMESTGRPMCIHVSAACRRLIGGPDESPDGAWHHTGGIHAKGKGFMETCLWEFLEPEEQALNLQQSSALYTFSDDSNLIDGLPSFDLQEAVAGHHTGTPGDNSPGPSPPIKTLRKSRFPADFPIQLSFNNLWLPVQLIPQPLRPSTPDLELPADLSPTGTVRSLHAMRSHSASSPRHPTASSSRGSKQAPYGVEGGNGNDDGEGGGGPGASQGGAKALSPQASEPHPSATSPFRPVRAMSGPCVASGPAPPGEAAMSPLSAGSGSSRAFLMRGLASPMSSLSRNTRRQLEPRDSPEPRASPEA